MRGHTARASPTGAAWCAAVTKGARRDAWGQRGRSRLRTSPLAGKVNLLDKNTGETAVAVYTRRPPGGASGKGPPANAGGPAPGVTGPTDPWRRAWQPTPVLKPGEEPHGPRSPQGHKKSDTSEVSEHPCRSQISGKDPLHSPGPLRDLWRQEGRPGGRGRVSTQS